MPTPIPFSASGSSILIQGDAGDIEISARLGIDSAGGDTSPLLVVCHPHPLHGGTMDNKVVTTLARAARDLGVDQVRFNFRGVGRSQGEHDHMQGESRDLDSILSQLRSQRPHAPIALAGFSFGSGVASMVVLQRKDISGLFLVAPPVDKYQGVYSLAYPCRVCIYQGAEDEVVDAQAVAVWQAANTSDSSIRWFDDTGHFFHGRLTALQDAFAPDLAQVIQDIHD